MTNHYATLGLSETATDEEIKQAYRALAKRYHPDLHPGDAEAAKRFAVINEAMEAIGDPARRKEYDNKRLDEQRRAQAQAQAASAAAARASAMHGAGATVRPMAGMSQAASHAYVGSAAGAQQVINDAYRKGYNEGFAAANAARNTTAETWKKSAENWKTEAENRMREIDGLRNEIASARRRIAESEAETLRIEDTLRAQIAKTRDARLDSEVESAAKEDLRETLEGKIRELEEKIADLENKLNLEREARKYSEADKLRLTREVTRLKEENAALAAGTPDPAPADAE